MLDKNVFGSVLVVIGIVLIVLRKWVVDESLDAQYRIFGLRFSDRIVKLNYLVAPLLGIGIVIYGISVLLGVLK